jgi:hypothetical protein
MNKYDELIPKKSELTMNSKPITKSKTFWVNLATAVAGVVTTLAGSNLIQDNPQLAGIAATVLGVVNILLRLVTTTSVTVKSE